MATLRELWEHGHRRVRVSDGKPKDTCQITTLDDGRFCCLTHNGIPFTDDEQAAHSWLPADLVPAPAPPTLTPTPEALDAAVATLNAHRHAGWDTWRIELVGNEQMVHPTDEMGDPYYIFGPFEACAVAAALERLAGEMEPLAMLERMKPRDPQLEYDPGNDCWWLRFSNFRQAFKGSTAEAAIRAAWAVVQGETT